VGAKIYLFLRLGERYDAEGKKTIGKRRFPGIQDTMDNQEIYNLKYRSIEEWSSAGYSSQVVRKLRNFSTRI